MIGAGRGAGTSFACGRCGGLLERNFDASLRIVCSACASVTTLDRLTGDACLDAAAKAFDHALASERESFGLGSTFVRESTLWQVIGVQTFHGEVGTGAYTPGAGRQARYTVWWLLDDRREIAWIGEQAGLRFWSDPLVPDDPFLPPDDSKWHEFGRWTLVDAAGEFPYPLRAGERHLTIERNARHDGMAIEIFLDEDAEPRRIQHTMTRMLDDIDVLSGIGDTASRRSVFRWRRARQAGLAVAVAAVSGIVAVVVSPAPWLDGTTGVGLALTAFASIVVASVSEARATRIGHRTAFLTRRSDQ